MSGDGQVRAARDGTGIVTLTLDRPASLNAMTDAMWRQLDALLKELPEPGDRVIVLTGAGESFCSGSDVTGLLDEAGLAERVAVSNRCVLAMHHSPLPTVAVVDGIAAGSGANLGLACDFVLASDRARFSQVFIRRGLSLDSGGSWLLPRLVGERKAKELALLGESVSGREAYECGLTNRVVAVSQLWDEATALAARLAQSSPEALAGNKRLLDDAWHHGLAEALQAETDNQISVIGTPTAQRELSDFSRKRRR